MYRSLLVAGAVLLSPAIAGAQSVEDFYRGKTVSVIIGYPPAGANDLYARAVARHVGRHIPGNPAVVPRNMPGGGSLLAANHIFNVAAKDGTTLGLIVPTAPLEERLGAANVRFKAAQFNWIGRLAPTPNVTFTMASSPVKTIQDAMARESVLEALRVFANASDVGRFILATPDTPADRIQALRRAFDAMVRDPEFMADLKTQKLELGPLAGEELQKLVAEVANVSPATIERVRGIYSVN